MLFIRVRGDRRNRNTAKSNPTLKPSHCDRESLGMSTLPPLRHYVVTVLRIAVVLPVVVVVVILVAVVVVVVELGVCFESYRPV